MIKLIEIILIIINNLKESLKDRLNCIEQIGFSLGSTVKRAE